MAHDYEDALDYSSRWLDLIHKTDFPTVEEAHRIIDESKYNFAEHYNRNWLEYRKSVTEAGDWAAVEWTGSGAVWTMGCLPVRPPATWALNGVQVCVIRSTAQP